MVGQELVDKQSDDAEDAGNEATKLMFLKTSQKWSFCSEPVRLHRRAIPSPSGGPKRLFQLDDDLFQVQSHSALFTESPNTDKVKPMVSKNLHLFNRLRHKVAKRFLSFCAHMIAFGFYRE